MGKALFKKIRELLPMFMVLTALWQMFGAVSIYTAETFFLTRTWQGKSFAGNFVIPAVLWVFLCLFERGKPKSGRGLSLKEGWSIRENGKSILGEKKEDYREQSGCWILLSCLN
ncbi:MAG: hypothetical protein K2O97_05995, partial [Acetatifactor sp.]|nr:hypothetical protein [Acetatifactor sp.]